MNKKSHDPLFHLTKRTEVNKKQAWIIRIIAFVISIFLCGIVSAILSGKGLGFFFTNFFDGIFGTPRKIWNLFHETALILMIALAVTPCFKMKFWNIGGEGQILMGAVGCTVIVFAMGGNFTDGATIVTSLVVAIAFGVAWAVIPALFKAQWNTNETLLTLMMNYIAMCLCNFYIKSVDPKGTGSLSLMKSGQGLIGSIGNNEFILKIIVAAILTVFMWVYLKYTKHGYELSVVGESENTARYIGINTKKVILRTLILCGVMSGIVGFLLVSATHYSLDSGTTVNGRGFTGVLISWLGHFNPFGIALGSFVYVFFSLGAKQVGILGRLGGSYPSVVTGIFMFVIIASEFFINYQVKFKYSDKIKKFLAPILDKLPKKKPKAAAATAGADTATETPEELVEPEIIVTEEAAEATEENAEAVEETAEATEENAEGAEPVEEQIETAEAPEQPEEEDKL